MLLDRYAVTDAVDWVVSQVQQYVGWRSEFLVTLMTRTWNMSPGSIYRIAITDLCERRLKKEFGEEWFNHELEFGVFQPAALGHQLNHLILPLPPTQEHAGLQVRLQLLSWAHAGLTETCWVGDAVTLGDVDILMQTIADGIQKVIDRWSGTDQGSDEVRPKRQKVSM
eukprot:UN4283